MNATVPNRGAAITLLIHGVAVVVTIWLYYRLLKLQNLGSHSRTYSVILLFMIGVILTNMALSLCNPPTPDSEPTIDISRIMSRVSLMVSYIFVINIMIRDYNRTHTANSLVVQNILVVITICVMIITVVLWVPQSDIVMNRAIRDIVSATFTIAMGYFVILVIDIIKRGGESQTPDYLLDAIEPSIF